MQVRPAVLRVLGTPSKTLQRLGCAKGKAELWMPERGIQKSNLGVGGGDGSGVAGQITGGGAKPRVEGIKLQTLVLHTKI